MNPEAQRIAIAETCGFKGCTDSTCDYRKCQHLHKDGNVFFPEGYSTPRYPDYLNDLNAMHDIIMSEAEQKGFGFQADFQLKLQEVVERRRPHLNREQIGWWMNNATAAQRAEAFLKTKGLWTE